MTEGELRGYERVCKGVSERVWVSEGMWGYVRVSEAVRECQCVQVR